MSLADVGEAASSEVMPMWAVIGQAAQHVSVKSLTLSVLRTDRCIPKQFGDSEKNDCVLS